MAHGSERPVFDLTGEKLGIKLEMTPCALPSPMLKMEETQCFSKVVGMHSHGWSEATCRPPPPVTKTLMQPNLPAASNGPRKPYEHQAMQLDKDLGIFCDHNKCRNMPPAQ